MNSKVQEKCDLLVANLAKMNKVALLDNHILKIIAAAAFTEAGRELDVKHYEECIKILRKKEFFLSPFRSKSELIVAGKMALSEDPQKYIEDCDKANKVLDKGKIFGSGYNVITATVICDMDKMSELDMITERITEILSGMKKKHPFLTSEEDTCFAALLAMTGKTVENIVDEVETIFQELKKRFPFHDNAAYSLSQVLATYEGDPMYKANKVMELYKALLDADVKYGKDYELSSLGTMIFTDIGNETFAEEVKETVEYLKTQKGFKLLDVSGTQRIMFSALLVSGVYSGDNQSGELAAIGGTIARLIAEQAALMSCVIASSVAAASSSN